MRSIDIKADLITPAIALKLIPAFESAYEMVLSTVEDNEFLGGDLRDQILPHLKNWAVEYELNRRAQLGLIPFTSSFEDNVRKNHKHLELRKEDYLITVSQTHRLLDLPRDCIFRNRHSITGQYCLKDFNEDDESNEKRIYAILTHGQGIAAPQYILCGIPSPDMKSWVQSVDLFDLIGNLKITDEAPVTEEIKLGFRDSVAKKVKNA